MLSKLLIIIGSSPGYEADFVLKLCVECNPASDYIGIDTQSVKTITVGIIKIQPNPLIRLA